MKDLRNKALIYLLCISQMWIPSDTMQIIACCLTVIITCLLSYFDHKQIQICLLALYCLLCIPYPVFALFLPVLLYDAADCFQDHPIGLYLIFAAILYTLPHHSPVICFNQLLFSLIAYVMQQDSRNMHTLLTLYHTYRDNSTESTLHLQAKNAALIVQQDYEISMAMISERNRIARDIHDNVGHMLTRSILQTAAIQVINQDSALIKPIQELHTTLNTAMTSIRNSVHNLHQDTTDLKHTIEEIIRTTPNLTVRLEYDINTPLPSDLQYAFIAIIREALNNVTKHSNADQVYIRLKEHPALFQLLIEDNGTGIEEIRHTGIGLSNMQERIYSLHGNINFSTKNGFRIFISVIKKE